MNQFEFINIQLKLYFGRAIHEQSFWLPQVRYFFTTAIYQTPYVRQFWQLKMITGLRQLEFDQFRLHKSQLIKKHQNPLMAISQSNEVIHATQLNSKLGT